MKSSASELGLIRLTKFLLRLHAAAMNLSIATGHDMKIYNCLNCPSLAHVDNP